MSSVSPGTNGGAPADSATASSLPTNEMCPIGYVQLVVAEVEIVHAECLLEHGRVGHLRDRQQHRVDVPHVVPADDPRSVRQAVRMAIVCRSQQQGRRIDRSARRHDDVASKGVRLAVTLDDHAGHFAAGRARFEPRDPGVGQERHVPMRQRRIHTDNVSVALGAAAGTESRRRCCTGCSG